jgi:hypothetical protein
MQIRGEFFDASFVNVGGAVNNIAELELVAKQIEESKKSPALVFLTIDPWWFNARFPESRVAAHVVPKPEIVSADLTIDAAKALRHGNWLKKAHESSNLGIYALLADQGYSRDGSFNYFGTFAGTLPTSDAKFSDTLSRIAEDRNRFQKNAQPDLNMVRRACGVIATLRAKAGHLVVLAPPFSSVVWRQMQRGGYEYISKAYASLRACSAGTEFYDFSDPATVGGTDCEFVDGFHGGDVTYARILQKIGAKDPQAKHHLRDGYLDRSVVKYAGFAGVPLQSRRQVDREIDFLKIGCTKRIAAGQKWPYAAAVR